MFLARIRSIAVLFVSLALLSALVAPMGVSAQGNSENAQGGYLNYTDVDGNAFKNAGQCTRYVAQGNDLAPVRSPDASLTFSLSTVFLEVPHCMAHLSVSDYSPGSYTVTFSERSGIHTLTVATDGTGTVSSTTYEEATQTTTNYHWATGLSVTAYVDGTAVDTELSSC